MIKSEVGQPKGILNLKAGEHNFQLSRLAVPADLRPFVEHYWIVSWGLPPRQTYRSESLSHPSIHLVIEKGKSRIVGVVTGKFTRVLKNRGRIFGVKFVPGGFYPFVKSPISRFTDRRVPLSTILGRECAKLEDAMLSPTGNTERDMAATMTAFLRARLPREDPSARAAARIVASIAEDPQILKVDQLLSRFRITKRSLQRLFSQYVGVSPKWVIQRYRLQHVVEQLAAGGAMDWSQVAQNLGYFDQAHFIKDFKAIVGKTPAEYTRSSG